MKSIVSIMKKELHRVFSDKKMIFSLFILPAIIVIGIYSLMGVLVTNMIADQENHVATVLVANAPEDVEKYINGNENIKEYKIEYTQDAKKIKVAKKDIYSGDLDLLVVFGEDFANQISVGEVTPDVKTFYNPSEDYSNNAREAFVNNILSGYKEQVLGERLGDASLLTVFTIDADNSEAVIQNDDKASGKMLGSFIPYIITILLFAGAMSLGVDTFAGEKERGTMASMLILPIKRSNIVYGKLFALMILSGLSALVYGGSMIVAMPVMIGFMGKSSEVMSGIAEGGLSLSFSPSQIIMLLIVIVSLVFVYVALIALPAIFAKDTKVGATYVMPIYMIVMVSGMLTIFMGEDPKVFEYMIPLYGSAVALKNIFTTDITGVTFMLTILTNLFSGGLIAFIVTRAFNSEKIMFNA